LFRNKELGERNRVAGIAALVVLLFLAAGCNQNMTFQMMGTQPKYRPLVPSDQFGDGQSARPLLPGTVARGHLEDDVLLYTGKQGNDDSTVFPFAVDRDVLARGQERFDIFCATCHGRTGAGNGLVVQRGSSPPPTFHQDRLRTAPVGHFFDVITNGFGAMPNYGKQIPVRDRWAIIAYIRALQLSQNATIGDVPPEERSKLGGP
jgi:cytochrome c5